MCWQDLVSLIASHLYSRLGLGVGSLYMLYIGCFDRHSSRIFDLINLSIPQSDKMAAALTLF